MRRNGRQSMSSQLARTWVGGGVRQSWRLRSSVGLGAPRTAVTGTRLVSATTLATGGLPEAGTAWRVPFDLAQAPSSLPITGIHEELIPASTPAAAGSKPCARTSMSSCLWSASHRSLRPSGSQRR